MWAWGWIWMAIWIAALLFAVWLIVGSPARRSAADDAMSILRERFARGEINQEEFERACDALFADQRGLTR